MVRFVNGQYEPDDSDVAVRILAHEMFLGIAIGAVNKCQGYIRALERVGNSESVAIRALLPLVEYDALVRLLELEIPDVKVERE